jgi:HD-like signal output (HDOD) protein
MQKKRILVADADAHTLEDFKLALGEAWEVTSVANGNAALAAMEQPQDVVVADLDLDEIDGVEFLNGVQATYPKTTRFILACEADRERMVKQVMGTHRFLGKPLDRSTLKNAIEGALALESWIPTNSIRELTGRIRTLPTIPTLYLEVQAALRSPDTTTDQVGAIIAKDMAMTTKLLQVLNSACFGLSRKITNPTEAVGILGFETVSSMVMTIKLLSQYDKVKPVYFSIDRLWRHSTEVARSAKQIALWQTDDAALAEMAFTAGLMHDIGKVVLAANFDEQYRGAQSLARKQGMELWEVEKEIFGATHGEIGAYLLGLWGMPLDLLEVAALHHYPTRSLSKNFTALTAVHVANALEREISADQDGLPVSKLDESYLAEIGVLENVPDWRAAVSKRDFTKSASKIRMAKSTAIIKPTAPSSVPNSNPPAKIAERARFVWKTEWTYWAAGAAVVLLVVACLSIELMTNRPELVQARSQPAPEKTVAKLVPVQPTATPSIPDPAPLLASVTSSNSTKVTATPAVATRPAPKESGFATIKLQGIFFSANHPSAIINGQRVERNDRVGDVLVKDITSSTVTLEYQKQRKTLVLD